MKSKIGVLGKLALLAGSLTLVLIAAEIGVRVLGLAPPAPSRGSDSVESVVLFDAKLETRYQANAHTKIQSQYGEFAIDYDFNELGLRDRAVPSRSEDNSFRILALGNSFVEGWGVQTEDSFLHVAEARLNAARSRPERSVRIVNGGASGYGAAQCYLLCKELLPKTQPDAVVFFYLPTMLPADQKFLAKAELNKEQIAQGLNVDAVINAPTTKKAGVAGNAFVDSAIVTGMSEYSCLARLVRSRVANRAAQQSIVPGDSQSDLFAAYRAPAEKLADMHAGTLRHVLAMARLAREAGLPFVVVQLPMPFEISTSEWGHGRQIYGLTEEVRVPSELRRLPMDALQKEEIPLFAAHEFLAEKAQSQPGIYFAFDFHLNATGQRLLGEWLADKLAKTIETPSIR
jgi:lysophospholipase L1-like esterase